jgi:hypothetical protein
VIRASNKYDVSEMSVQMSWYLTAAGYTYTITHTLRAVVFDTFDYFSLGASSKRFLNLTEK